MLISFSILVFGKNETRVYHTPTPIPQNAALEDWISILTPTTQCPLPCWQSIIPGDTTLDEAESILLAKFDGIESKRLSINAAQENMSVTKFRMRLENTPNETSGFVMCAYFEATNDVVKNITLTSMEDSMVGSNETILAWEAFSIRNTLHNYGTPDVVQTYLEQTSDGLIGNSLWLYWEDYGLAVEYREDLVVPSAGIPNAPICYNLENLDYLRVWLQEPNNINSLLDTTSTFSLGIKNLAEISDISNQEFRQILLNNNGCLPTNLPVDWD